MQPYMPDSNDRSNLVEEPTLGQHFFVLVLLLAGNSAVSTAAMAAGMATLKAAGYPGFTATNEALISAAIGPMVCVPAAKRESDQLALDQRNDAFMYLTDLVEEEWCEKIVRGIKWFQLRS